MVILLDLVFSVGSKSIFDSVGRKNGLIRAPPSRLWEGGGSAILWAVNDERKLVSGEEGEIFGNRATYFYNRGILASKMMILEFSNKKGEKDKWHEIQIFIHR